MLKRQTAKKIRILDLTNGEWVKKEGMEPSYVLTKTRDMVSRARIMGTIVSRFTSEDGNFGSITLDDSTDTIRAKTFKTIKPIEGFNVGDLVEMIGKLREYNGELYMMPEIIRKVQDPNLLLLRRLEIAKTLKGGKSEGEKEVKDLRKEVLDFIGSKKDGVSFQDMLKGIKAQEGEIEKVINEVLAEGICYEPTPGKIKKI